MTKICVFATGAATLALVIAFMVGVSPAGLALFVGLLGPIVTMMARMEPAAR